jgi:hypothetical protein
MGHYKLDVLAVGGHGCQREKGDGVAVLGCNRSDCPDCIIREMLRRLQRSGNTVHRARLTHWPADEGLGMLKENEVVDDLSSGMRLGSFAPGTASHGPGLTLTISDESGAPDYDHMTNRRTVRGLLEELLGPVTPASAAVADGGYDYSAKGGVYRFTNAGGSAYTMGAELRHLQLDTMPKPWRIKKQPA